MAKISLNRSAYALYVGNADIESFSDWCNSGSSVMLSAKIESKFFCDSDIKWSITNKSIAFFKTKKDGLAEVKACRTGNVRVCASLPDGSAAFCDICVIDNGTRLTVNRIDLNTTELNLKPGSSARLHTILYPKDIFCNEMLNKTVFWASTNIDAVTVKDGVVYAKSEGYAEIVAKSKDNGTIVRCRVTVSENVKQEKLENSRNVEMTVGDTLQLTDVKNANIVWVSDNQYVVSVDENGVATALSASLKQKVMSGGMNVIEKNSPISIYATAKNGGETVQYHITVKPKKIKAKSVSLKYTELMEKPGSSCEITAVVNPPHLLNPNIVWESSNPEVVSVKETTDTIFGAKRAIIKTITEGEAIITAVCGDVRSEGCVVKIKSENLGINIERAKTIGIDEVYTLKSDKDVYWLISDSDVASIDRDGNVMGYSEGIAVVYAISKESISVDDYIMYVVSRKLDGIMLSEILENAEYEKCVITVNDECNALRYLHIPKETITHDSVCFLWSRASLIHTENFEKYIIYINGKKVSETQMLGYRAQGLLSETEYTFEVAAVDKNGKELLRREVKAITKKNPKVLNVLEYGAVGNGLVLDTVAIQKAIDECPEGGEVWVPGDGRVYVSGSLFLKSNMTLRVDGTLLGSTDPKDYPRIINLWEGWRRLEVPASRWDATTESVPDSHLPHSSLITAGVYDEGDNGKTGPYNIKNLIICGSGQINANGFVLAYNEGPNHVIKVSRDYPVLNPTMRGNTISIRNAESVYVKDVLIAYPPAWTTHVINSRNVTFDGCEVVSSGNGDVGKGTDIVHRGHIRNGDGIDPESCTHFNIFNVHFTTGDDAVAMKSGRNKEGNLRAKPNAYIRITDSEVTESVAGFCTGSENAGGAHDLLLQNLKLSDIKINGIWLKTTKARGGLTRHIQIRDMEIDRANTALCFSHKYKSGGEYPADRPPVLEYVTVENVSSDNTEKFIVIEGLEESHIKKLKFNTVRSRNNAPNVFENCDNTEIINGD